MGTSYFVINKRRMFLKNLVGKCRSAIDLYNMIEKDDVIAVGVSGGKDSLMLLSLLLELKNYYPVPFKILAITVDPQFLGKKTNFSDVTDFCSAHGIRHIVERTELSKLIFEERREKNPCSLCSRMRRGIISNVAVESGCNKVALGHNLDDAVETFFMNLLNGGRIGCFSPVSYLSRKKIHVIRPLIFCSEKEIVLEAKRLFLPIVKSGCPVDGKTERQSTKELISFLEKDYCNVKKKIIGAITKANVDDWGKENIL